MVDVLEAMGFPSDWCEKALSSASGIETAVDLLLQWQAHGAPQFPPPSVRPNPSSPSLGQNTQPLVRGGQGLPNPTLRLLPLPNAVCKAVIDEHGPSPSVVQPSTSSSGPSSLDGPSGLNEAINPESPSGSSLREGPNENLGGGRRIGPSRPSPCDRMTMTGNSSVDDGRQVSGRGAGSSRIEQNTDSTDAVVPDAFAEERKGRYAAAQRAKQEKEAEKAKIRQQLQEDMVQRRFRHTSMAPTDNERNLGKEAVSHNRPFEVAMDTSVQLQIRCSGSQVMRGSFTAANTLRDVRAYVERQLQRPPMVPASQHELRGFRPGAVPFSGQSSRLSSDRQAERELLQAARENFEVQTSRILASAKTLRYTAMENDIQDGQSRGTIYFLIPIPRQEFFTEAAMDLTLAQAQLVPRGTLIVQFRSCDTEGGSSLQGQPKPSTDELDDHTKIFGHDQYYEHGQSCVARLLPGSAGHEIAAVEAENVQVNGILPSRKVALSIERPMNGTPKSGRALEVDGERVRVRELALQAAAKRMSEAAKIFREGLPLEEGETGGAFPFPTEEENAYIFDSPALFNGGIAAQQARAGLDDSAPTEDCFSPNLKAAGADAELLDASHGIVGQPADSSGSDSLPVDRSLDTLHRQAMAAAEARLRNSQNPPTVRGPVYIQEPEEAESRICADEPESRPPRGRARVPLSSRLLSRPEKLQRTSDSPPSSSPSPYEVLNNIEELARTASSSRPQLQMNAGAGSHGPLEAALQRFNAVSQRDSKGKGPLQDQGSSQGAVISSSHQLQAERQSTLRVRLEDGNVVPLTFPANTSLQSVRDSVIPEGADTCAYGFFVPIPEPHFVEGEDLGVSLEEVGLVPRGILHLIKVASRGMVRQGRRVPRRRGYVPDSDDEGMYSVMEGMFRQLADHTHNRQDLTYEELMELEESIGRVHVGVPEEVIAALPTHMVKIANGEETTEDGNKECVDVCIVCMAEMVNGEEAMSLPCIHTFHTVCIRRWLLQSTCCPTCKQCLV